MAKVVKKEKKSTKEVKPEKTVKGKKAKAEVPAKKESFGGYKVCFKGENKTTLESLFGKEPIPAPTMMKTIYAYIEEKKLSNAKPKTPLMLLKKYWSGTKYEDLDEAVFNKHVRDCGGKKKAVAEVSEIFADSAPGEDEFEEAIETFYKKFVKAVASKEE